MFISTLLPGRFILIAALALVLATAAYGFAAANTFTDGLTAKLGDGSQAISGYTVDNVQYTLDASAQPSTISAVDFDLTGSPVAAHVRVQLVGGGAVYSSDGGTPACTLGSATGNTVPVTCTVPDIGADSVDTLHVVASSDPLQ
jgi:hypothetical protein